jgi:uncharacterized HhH-GPD family protein
MVTVKHIDYSHFEGGLVRMMDRFKEEGTLIGDIASDDFVRENANAALLGLLYDQRVRAEFAFTGPERLRERIGHLDMQKIADADPDRFCELFGQQPAVHRFTNTMAEMTQKLARVIADEYSNDAANLWNDGSDFATIKKRARALPGFGEQKSAKLKFVLHYFGYRDFSEDPTL